MDGMNFTAEPTDVQVFTGGKAVFLCARVGPMNREWRILPSFFRDFQSLMSYVSAGEKRLDRSANGTGICLSDVEKSDNGRTFQCRFTDCLSCVSSNGTLTVILGKHKNTIAIIGGASADTFRS